MANNTSFALFMFLVLPTIVAKGTETPVRIVGPSNLAHGSVYSLRVEAFDETSKNWYRLSATDFGISVTGDACIVTDPSRNPTNPITVTPLGNDFGKATFIVGHKGNSHTFYFEVGGSLKAEKITISVDSSNKKHRFQGMGGGIMFYDNQWELSRGDEMHNWCFRDIQTHYLHFLLRPDYEVANDNSNAFDLDISRFDFKSSEHLVSLILKAKQIRPQLQLFATLYSPPTWMKTNESTKGTGSLKADLENELAEYVFASLKFLESKGVKTDYLSFFNEPDYSHEQLGMRFADIRQTVEAFDKTSKTLDKLLEVSDFPRPRPGYVFPELLGPGAVTENNHNLKLLNSNELAGKLSNFKFWGFHDYWYSDSTYWDQRYVRFRNLLPDDDREIWMTEWAQRYKYGDIGSACEYATMILNALRLGASTWMVFEWAHPSENQSGLISCDWYAPIGNPKYWRSKAYHVFRQIANLSPIGSHIVPTSINKTSNVEHLALRSERGLTLHIFNGKNTPIELIFEHSFEENYTATSMTTTSPLDNFLKTNPHSKIPALSLATIKYEEH